MSASDLPSFSYPIGDVLHRRCSCGADAATFKRVRRRRCRRTSRTSWPIRHSKIAPRCAISSIKKLELQLLSGTDDAAALATADQIRALEDKPDAKLLSGLSTRAIVGARAQAGAASGPAFLAAFQALYAAALAPLPWAVVGPSLKEIKTTYEAITPAFVIGQTAGTYDAAAAKTHTLGGDAAVQVLRARYYAQVVLPLGVPGAAVIRAHSSRRIRSRSPIFGLHAM